MSASAGGTPQPAADLRLPERYEVRRHLATGGMGSVWCAEDRILGRSVAIKVLAERFAHDELAVKRFKREARAAARVSAHPHVVTIFDVGDTDPAPPGDAHRGGPGTVTRAFIVMEHLSGGSVSDALRVGTVKRQEALRWLREAASALDHAHERGIVHRDIKPGNLLLDAGRRLHVADFGIARLLSEDTITASGELFGTAAYLSPEQALGVEATSASDRYSLAVAAFELLTGERPFTSSHFAAQARQHIEDEPPLASERHRGLPPQVDEVLTRGMAKAPDARYETAAGFVAALEAALSVGAGSAVAPRARRPDAGAVAGPIAGAPATISRAAPPTMTTRAATRPATRPAIRTAPAAPRPMDKPPVAGARRHRGRRAIALSALSVAALGVALLVVLTQLDSGSSRPAHSRLAARTATSRHVSTPAKPASTAASKPAAPATTTAAARTDSSTAAALLAQGHALMLQGSYPAAIAALRQAVSAADPASTTYAYALYDLGRSLVLSGNPQAAIPVLQQRLKIPNQTPVVQQQLNQALQAAGQAPPPAPSSGASGPNGAGASPGSGHRPGDQGAGPGGQGAGPGGPGNGHGQDHGHGSGGGSVSPGWRQASGAGGWTLSGAD